MYVQLKNINKSFGNFKASDNVNLDVKKGSLTALLGPSGSGKTTILRIIAGLETPDSGDIIIDGNKVNDLAPAKRGIGFVFQNYALFRYMTVYENIAFGLAIAKIPKKQMQEQVDKLIDLVGLNGMEKRYPNQLSGGQRQRVAFARALAPNPSLLLLDEPFAAIDAKVRTELRVWLREMIHRIGITSIFVTHDQEEAVEVADEIIVTHMGKIEQIGSVMDIYKKPETPFVAEFIGHSNHIDDFSRLKGFENQGYDGAFIRPEFIEAFKSDNAKFHDLLDASEEGIVEDVIFHGNRLELHINVKGLVLNVSRSLERRPIEEGEKMRVIIYRLYAYVDNKVYLLKNSNINGEAIVTF